MRQMPNRLSHSGAPPLCYITSFQQTDDSPCGLDEVNGHVEGAHVVKDCSWPLETAGCLQPIASKKLNLPNKHVSIEENPSTVQLYNDPELEDPVKP